MIKTGSDFSGVGAFDQALSKLKIDYKTVYACDMDKYARQTYIENYGEPDYYPENVYDREIPKQSLDIYMTSPPCQSFSLAGKRKGEDSVNGVLFYNSHEFIIKNKPRYFIFENVKGLLSDAKGRTFQIWLDMLGGKSVNGNPVLFPREDATPYHIYHKVLNAKHFGVPQNRERVFIIGIRDDSDNQFSFPKPFHLTKRLKDVLESEVVEKYYLSEKMVKVLEHHKNAIIKNETPEKSGCIHAGYYKMGGRDQQYIRVASNLEKYYLTDKNVEALLVYNKRQKDNDTGFSAKFRDIETTKTMDDLKVGGGGKDDLIKVKSPTSKEKKQTKNNVWVADYRTDEGLRIRKDGNSPCMTASMRPNTENMKRGNCVPFVGYNEKIRRLTPRECFRLMDFPDSFTWPVSDTQAYKQAGNSIVVNVLAEIINKLKID